jgi:hypothetical protein
MKRRLVVAVMCMPMPPFFLALPLRHIWLPLVGRVPVNSQILDISVLSQRAGNVIGGGGEFKNYFATEPFRAGPALSGFRRRKWPPENHPI